MGDRDNVVELRTCPIEGCSTRIRHNLLMCHLHWRMVPATLRCELLVTWDSFRTNRDRDQRRLALQAYTLAKARALQAVNAVVMDGITRPPEDCVPCDTEASR